MIANETTRHRWPNDTEINIYRSPYGLQQWAKPIPHYAFLEISFGEVNLNFTSESLKFGMHRYKKMWYPSYNL